MFNAERCKVRETHLYLLNAVHESQQWGLADLLTPALGNPFGAWDTEYRSPILTPADYTAMSRFLSHVKSPLQIAVTAIGGKQCMQHLTCDSSMHGYNGLSVATGDEGNYITSIEEIVNSHTSLQYLALEAFDEIKIKLSKVNHTLQHLEFDSKCCASPDMDVSWIPEYSVHFTSLNSLTLKQYSLNPWVLRGLPNLQYLRLIGCVYTEEQMQAVADLIVTLPLLLLMIQEGDEGTPVICKNAAMILAPVLKTEKCRLEALYLGLQDFYSEGMHAICYYLQENKQLKVLALRVN